jgi:hypothetical protein
VSTYDIMVGFDGLTRPFERQRLCPDDLVKTENGWWYSITFVTRGKRKEKAGTMAATNIYLLLEPRDLQFSKHWIS